MILAIILNFNGTIYELDSFNYDLATGLITQTATADLVFRSNFE